MGGLREFGVSINILLTTYSQTQKMDKQIFANKRLSFDTDFKVLGQHGWANFIIKCWVLWVKSRLGNFENLLANCDASFGIYFEILE